MAIRRAVEGVSGPVVLKNASRHRRGGARKPGDIRERIRVRAIVLDLAADEVIKKYQGGDLRTS